MYSRSLVWFYDIIWLKDLAFSFNVKKKLKELSMRITSEFKSAELGDKRLNTRLQIIAKLFQKKHGSAICFSCGDSSASTAAYRFFNNESFNEKDILKPHIEQTVKRVKSLTNSPLFSLTPGYQKYHEGFLRQVASYVLRRKRKEYYQR